MNTNHITSSLSNNLNHQQTYLKQTIPDSFWHFSNLVQKQCNAQPVSKYTDLLLTTLTPYPAWLSQPVELQSPIRSIFLYFADTHTHVSKKCAANLLKTTPFALHLFFYPDELVDCAFTSPINRTIVTALDINWNNNPSFWKLLTTSSPITLAIQLELFFGKQKIQRKFVAVFKRSLNTLSNAWQQLSTDNPKTRHNLSFHTLLRILFLAFLETRGLLDNRKAFIMEEASRSHKYNKNIYNDFFRPFFFGTLNVPPSKRAARAKKFGTIPFLNGGLFKPTHDESTNPSRFVHNDVLLSICSNLLDSWEFSDHETRHADSALDPMMLGHVFEMLMSDEMRSVTGSFYSPMNLVRDITARALSAWIAFNCCIPDHIASNLVSNGETSSLTELQATNCLAKLHNIKILDLSSGSGAFLQEASEILHRAISALSNALGQPQTPPQLARSILLNNIFGVDILEPANRICELRLWLSTIKYYKNYEQLPPLPNLDLNIRCGHALLDLTQYALSLGMNISQQQKNNSTSARLRRKYGVSTGRTKQKLAQQIETLDANLETDLLLKLKNSLKLQIAQLQSAWAVQNLFGEQQPPPPNVKAQIKTLTENLQQLETNYLPGTFSFDVHFSHIMQSGGFDLILGNPPWFALHTRPQHEQTCLKRLYQVTETVERSTRFAAQSMDISALFVEKSLRISKPGAIVAMLLPNKLFSAPSYERFRMYIKSHAYCVSSHDWSDSPENTFDAATYPADLILRRIDACQRSQDAWITDADACRIDIQSPTPEARALSAISPTIGSTFTIKRGLYTSANNLFLGTFANTNNDTNTAIFQCNDTTPTDFHFDALAIEQSVPIERNLLYPILRGADINAFHASPRKFILMTHEPLNLSKPAQSLPDCANRWIERNRQTLLARRNISRSPHAVFGLSSLMLSPKVVWKDISEKLSACFIKDPNTLVLNTGYYIPVPNEDIGYLLSAFLNATPIRSYCEKNAEFARGGYRRFFAWLISSIPWPFNNNTDPSITKQLIEISKEAHDAPLPNALSPRRQARLDNCVIRAIAMSNFEAS